MEKLLAPKEVAEICGISEWQARQIMEKVGKVQGIGKKCRVRPSDLDAYTRDPEGYLAAKRA